ncbi:MAG: helix-turn-helix transcriptional regulator [bacterium]|nr:helix-turn-helix transcriptional regulator [bacterium]
MSKNQTWTIGEIIKQVREEKKITILQLSRGLCSPATLSRIEADKREMDMMMASILFERLGYNLDKFEFYGSQEECEQYDKRLSIQKHKESKEFEKMEQELLEYQAEIGENASPLHEQFIKKMWGFLAFQTGDYERAIQFFEEAIRLTVPDWQGEWEKLTILSLTELEILQLLADVYSRTGREEEAYTIRCSILEYLDKQNECREQFAELYTNIACKVLPRLVEKGEFQKGVFLCEKGIEILSAIVRMYSWPDLLYWKGVCLEKLLESGEVSEKEVIAAYKEAYYIYRLFSQNETAEKIKIHLEENYQWEFIG